MDLFWRIIYSLFFAFGVLSILILTALIIFRKEFYPDIYRMWEFFVGAVDKILRKILIEE